MERVPTNVKAALRAPPLPLPSPPTRKRGRAHVVSCTMCTRWQPEPFWPPRHTLAPQLSGERAGERGASRIRMLDSPFNRRARWSLRFSGISDPTIFALFASFCNRGNGWLAKISVDKRFAGASSPRPSPPTRKRGRTHVVSCRMCTRWQHLNRSAPPLTLSPRS